MDCGGVFVKYVLFIFNILVWICGTLLIVFGSIMVSKIGNISNMEEAFNANSMAIIILTLGCIIFLISFLGCCGAIRENSCSLMTYSFIMLGLFLCQLTLIIYIWVRRPEMLESLNKFVEKIWEQRKTDQLAMDALQKTLKCCGNKSPADYIFSPPLSCCDSGTSCSLVEAMKRPGCSQALRSFWESNINIVKFAGLGVAAIECVAFIFGVCLANQTRNNMRRANY